MSKNNETSIKRRTKSISFWRLVIVIIVIVIVMGVAVKTIVTEAQSTPFLIPEQAEAIYNLEQQIIQIARDIKMRESRLIFLEELIKQHRIMMEIGIRRSVPDAGEQYQELIRKTDQELAKVREEIENLQENKRASELVLENIKKYPEQIALPIIVDENFQPSPSSAEKKRIYSEYYTGLLKADARKLRAVLRIKPEFRTFLTIGEQRYIEILERLTRVLEKQACQLKTKTFLSPAWLVEMRNLLADINYLKTQAPSSGAERGYYRLIEELGDLLEKRLKQLEKF